MDSTSPSNMLNQKHIQQRKKHNLYVIFITKFIHGVGFSMFNVVYQPYLFEITQSEIILGYLTTFGMFMQFLPMQLSGKLADRYGRKSLILIGLFLFAIGLGFMTLFTELVLIIIGIFFVFLGFGIKDPPTQIIINENSPKKQSGLMFSIMFFGYFGGAIAGNLIVSSLGSAYNALFYFKIFFWIMIFQLIIQWLFLREKKVDTDKKNPPSSQPSDEISELQVKQVNIWKKLLQNPKTRNILIFFLIDGMIWGISLSIYRGALVATYGITKEQISIIVLVFNITNMVFQIPCGHLIDKIGKKKGIFLAEILGFVFFGLNILAWVLSSRGYLLHFLMVGYFVFGIIVSLFIPAQLALFSNLSKKNKTESYGVISMVLGLGFIPMGIISGLLIEKIHYIFPFIISIVCIPLELLYIIKFFPDDEKTE